MAGTVVAVFDDNSQAERAAQALLDDGVPLADITLVFHGAAGEQGTFECDQPARYRHAGDRCARSGNA